MLEGRSWGRIAIDKFDAIPCAYMKKDGYYLYQIFTEVHFKFKSLEEIEKFREYIETIDPYWDYDPVATIDTHDEETCKTWASQMAKTL